ncbi:MAG TPA: CZB domain-containing protein [Geobacteraceae bacterium]
MSDPSELNKAIKNHSIWKVRLKDAVDTGKSEFTPRQVRANHLCEFGKWLNSLPPGEKALEEYGKIAVLHEKFHAEAANVLQMALGGQKDKAHEALTDIRSDFIYTSAQLINALTDWKHKLS